MTSPSPKSATWETLASGFGLVEGPTVDRLGNLFFSDVLGGGVYRIALDDPATPETVIPKRRGVGGIVLHADGGLVVSGRDIAHVRDGASRSLFAIEGLPGWNDICTDARGSVYAGALRFMVFDRGATEVPGELWRIDSQSEQTCLYDGVVHANGVALSPDERTIYHSDSRARVVIVHTVEDDGTCVDRRTIDARELGTPDGMAVDDSGCVWTAMVDGGIVRFTPGGRIDQRLAVPSEFTTSVCFAGDGHDLIAVTGGNTNDPNLGGTVFRTRVEAKGAPVHPARA